VDELPFAEESYAICGAIFEASREIGSGLLESAYQECRTGSDPNAGVERRIL